ncbi:3'5'-cyclic nucleotide phosphodiesterase family protein [Pelomyxa schiedti]|nr:3'5'-cyclic nucleotide phosphodiesterase family protein [Pelomyxa schiedti]
MKYGSKPNPPLSRRNSQALKSNKTRSTRGALALADSIERVEELESIIALKDRQVKRLEQQLGLKGGSSFSQPTKLSSLRVEGGALLGQTSANPQVPNSYFKRNQRSIRNLVKPSLDQNYHGPLPPKINSQTKLPTLQIKNGHSKLATIPQPSVVAQPTTAIPPPQPVTNPPAEVPAVTTIPSSVISVVSTPSMVPSKTTIPSTSTAATSSGSGHVNTRTSTHTQMVGGSPSPQISAKRFEEACLSLNHVFEFISSISTSLHDVEQARQRICSEVVKLFNVERAYIYEVHKPQSLLALHTQDPASTELQTFFYPMTKGICGKVATMSNTLNISNATLHKEFDHDIDDKYGIKTTTILCAPIITDGAVSGVIQLVNKNPDQNNSILFTRQDELLLQCVLPHIASSLRNSQMLSSRNLLLAANRTISSELELPHLYWTITAKAAHLLSCESAALFMLDTRSNELFLTPSGRDSELTTVTKGDNIAWHVCTTGEFIHLPDAQASTLFNPLVDKPKSVEAVVNMMAAPIFNSKSTIGVIQVVNKMGCFTDEDVFLLQSFASQISEAVGNATTFTTTLRGFQAAMSTQHKFQALLEIAESLTKHLDGENLIKMILQKARTLVDAERSSLFLIDASANELCSQVAEGAEEIRCPMNQGIAGHVATTGEVLNITDAYADKRFNDEVDKKTGYHTRNIICVPIRNTQDDIIGVTQIINKRKGAFTKEDEELLKAFSIFCGVTLHNSNLYQKAIEAQKRSHALLDIVQALSTDAEIGHLMSTIMKRARELIDADRASLFILDPKSKELRSHVADGTDQIIVPTSSSIVGYVASTGQEVVVPDAYSDPRFNPGIDKATGYHTRNVLAIPVLNENGEVIAVTEMINKRGKNPFQEEDKQLLKAFALFCGKGLSDVAQHFKSAFLKPKRAYPLLTPSESDKNLIPNFDFDVRAFEDSESLIRLIFAMFDSFDLFTEFNIPIPAFLCFMHELSKSYNSVPYHNFYHAIDATQFLYSLICHSKVLASLPKIEIFSILLAALCHDVDHGGLNNTFQINAQTPLALLFSDTSIMETYHCSRSIALLSSESNNILVNMTESQRHTVWTIVISTILSTDMAVHFAVLEEFEAAIKSKATVDTVSHKLLAKVLMKCSDISNVCRPFPLARKWAEILLNEFFVQGDIERSRGLPSAPFNLRGNVVVAQMQIGFMNSIAFPIFGLLSQFLPDLKPHTVDILVKNAQEWTQILSNQSKNTITSPPTSTSTSTPTASPAATKKPAAEKEPTTASKL